MRSPSPRKRDYPYCDAGIEKEREARDGGKTEPYLFSSLPSLLSHFGHGFAIVMYLELPLHEQCSFDGYVYFFGTCKCDRVLHLHWELWLIRNHTFQKEKATDFQGRRRRRRLREKRARLVQEDEMLTWPFVPFSSPNPVPFNPSRAFGGEN